MERRRAALAEGAAHALVAEILLPDERALHVVGVEAARLERRDHVLAVGDRRAATRTCRCRDAPPRAAPPRCATCSQTILPVWRSIAMTMNLWHRPPAAAMAAVGRRRPVSTNTRSPQTTGVPEPRPGSAHLPADVLRLAPLDGRRRGLRHAGRVRAAPLRPEAIAVLRLARGRRRQRERQDAPAASENIVRFLVIAPDIKISARHHAAISRSRFPPSRLPSWDAPIRRCPRRARRRRIATRVRTHRRRLLHDYLEAFPYHALALGAPEVHPDRLGDHTLPAHRPLAESRGRPARRAEADSTSPIWARRPRRSPTSSSRTCSRAPRHFALCRTELWNVSPTWTGWQADLPVDRRSAGDGNTPRHRQQALARFAELPTYPGRRDREPSVWVSSSATRRRRSNVRYRHRADGRDAEGAARRLAVRADGEARRRRVHARSCSRSKPAQIRPAIARYRDFLSDVYLPAAREAVGVSANPRRCRVLSRRP